MSTRIIVDPSAGRMPAELSLERSGGRSWVHIHFDRSTAKGSDVAEHTLIETLADHCLGQRGIVGGYFSELVTDFSSEESLIRHLQDAGVVATEVFEV